MSALSDDALDALLRDRFDGPVPADDFCDRVMARLPARRRRREWPLATGLGAGATLCWLSLRSSPVAQSGWHDWLAGEPSGPAVALLLAIASLAGLALAWTVAEAGDGAPGTTGPVPEK